MRPNIHMRGSRYNHIATYDQGGSGMWPWYDPDFMWNKRHAISIQWT